MVERDYEREKYKALYVLQKMHDKLEVGSIFPESLKEEGRESLRELSQWKFKSQKEAGFNKEMIHLLYKQIRLSERIEREIEARGKADLVRAGIIKQPI